MQAQGIRAQAAAPVTSKAATAPTGAGGGATHEGAAKTSTAGASQAATGATAGAAAITKQAAAGKPKLLADAGATSGTKQLAKKAAGSTPSSATVDTSTGGAASIAPAGGADPHHLGDSLGIPAPGPLPARADGSGDGIAGAARTAITEQLDKHRVSLEPPKSLRERVGTDYSFVPDDRSTPTQVIEDESGRLWTYTETDVDAGYTITSEWTDESGQVVATPPEDGTVSREVRTYDGSTYVSSTESLTYANGQVVSSHATSTATDDDGTVTTTQDADVDPDGNRRIRTDVTATRGDGSTEHDTTTTTVLAETADGTPTKARVVSSGSTTYANGTSSDQDSDVTVGDGVAPVSPDSPRSVASWHQRWVDADGGVYSFTATTDADGNVTGGDVYGPNGAAHVAMPDNPNLLQRIMGSLGIAAPFVALAVSVVSDGALSEALMGVGAMGSLYSMGGLPTDPVAAAQASTAALNKEGSIAVTILQALGSGGASRPWWVQATDDYLQDQLDNHTA